MNPDGPWEQILGECLGAKGPDPGAAAQPRLPREPRQTIILDLIQGREDGTESKALIMASCRNMPSNL